MASYKLIGQRNLRKYTEAKTSPVYAAAVEAQIIVDSLCGIPWKKVAARDATMTYHTEETVAEIDGQKINGLEMNVRIRDEFDAALFCGDHSGGQHRAYANAAVYHYVLPDVTLPKLTKLTANVTSDPYNSAGARIAILTNATGEIPTNCNDCRTGDAHADGVAPRTVASNGNWFPTMADCVFSATPGEGETALPSGGLQLQKHLFVFVLMESYSTVRGNWLEGCSFIRNLISIETDSAVPGWTDGETYDLTESAVGSSFNILANGVLPRIPAGAFSGVRACEIRTDGNLVIEEDGSQTPISAAAGDSAAAALSRVYFLFDYGAGYIQRGACPRPGAAFNLTRTNEDHAADGSSLPQPTEVLRIDSSVLVVPFSLPRSFAPVSVRLAFAALSLSQGAAFNVFLAPDYRIALTEETLKNRFLYAEDGNVSGLTRLGSFSSGTSASLAIPDGLLSDGCGTVIITGSFPPELYNLETGGSQGTGPALVPSITISN